MTQRRHHQLLVWQQAVKLVKDTYLVTQTFPREELYGLTAQMRRAAISIPANIAEGAARSTDKEFAHYLTVARGPLSELETHVIVATELGLLKDDRSLRSAIDEVFALLGGLINTVRAK